MEKYEFFVGMDVSKDHLDYSIRDHHRVLGFIQLPNTDVGIKQALKWMRTFRGFHVGGALVCCEHSGIYSVAAVEILHSLGFDVWHEAPACIKSGFGYLRREKNDKVDAKDIADYAFTFRHKSRSWEPPREVITLLADLMALRERLIEVSKKMVVPANEIKAFKTKGHYKVVKDSGQRTMKAANRDFKDVNAQVLKLIQSDEVLKRLYKIITSVRGVGFVTAVRLIIATNEFKDINDPRKLACYAGCAPFTQSSGKKQGKGQVSHKADKKIKTLLHMCALSAIQCKGEIRDYYQRKTKEGKNRFVVINAVRNKLIHRICACVREDREYLPIK